MQGKVHYTYQENINKGKIIHCYCNNCTIETKHVVIFDYKEDVDDYEEGLSVKDDYQIIKCDNCNQLHLELMAGFLNTKILFQEGMMVLMKSYIQRVIEINELKRRFTIYHIL